MNAKEYLNYSSNILDERGKSRDTDQERSMAKIVKVFNELHNTNLTEEQGWSFMLILKQVRAVTGTYNQDDYVDLISYAALLAESTHKE